MLRYLLLLLVCCFNIVAYSQVSQYSKPREYSSYNNPYNLDLIYRASQYKQAKYNQNVAQVRDKLATVKQALDYIKRNNIQLSEEQFKWLKKNLLFIDNDLNAIDFSSDKNTYEVCRWLRNLAVQIYSWK